MKKSEEKEYFYFTESNQTKYTPQSKQNNPQWEFEKVQSVYEVNKELLNNEHENNSETLLNKKQQIEKFNLLNDNLDKPKHQLTFVPETKYQTKFFNEQERISRNLSSKTNTETNILSESQSLEYLSSQEPSFSNKSEFTVLEDFNLENHLNINKKQIYQPKNSENDWKTPSFSPKTHNNFNLKEKCTEIFEFIQELKFMKEGFESKLKQQQNYFINQLQEVKKLLFKLNIKYEKEILEFTKNNKHQSKLESSRLSMQSDTKENELYELRLYCKKLEEEKERSEQKYSSTLKKYQEQIEIISEELIRKISNENDQNLPSFQSVQSNCENCKKFEEILQKHTSSDQEIDIWKNRYSEEKERHNETMKKMEDEIFILQEELKFIEKSKIEIERNLKEKERQILYQQSEIEYRIKDIERREKDLQMAQIILKKEKDEIEDKKEKIADYEFKILREERKQKNQFKEREILSSEYFNSSNNDRRKVIPQVNNNYERSDSVLSSKGSRIDINARLKEIQMMKGKGQKNYDDSMNSRNSSKDSRYSGYKDFNSSRVSNSSKNLKDYGVGSTFLGQKEHKRESTQSIKLSEKLNRLTETLQNELREMN